jgi:hypothetical protein
MLRILPHESLRASHWVYSALLGQLFVKPDSAFPIKVMLPQVTTTCRGGPPTAAADTHPYPRTRVLTRAPTPPDPVPALASLCPRAPCSKRGSSTQRTPTGLSPCCGVPSTCKKMATVRRCPLYSCVVLPVSPRFSHPAEELTSALRTTAPLAPHVLRAEDATATYKVEPRTGACCVLVNPPVISCKPLWSDDDKTTAPLLPVYVLQLGFAELSSLALRFRSRIPV